MENKIYNAIQKGLANALVFNDNDSSVSYRKSIINSETEIPKVSFETLCNIFENDKEDIFKYNTIDCISLILNNGHEISLHEYKPSLKPVFMKVSNTLLKDNNAEIIFQLNCKSYTFRRWLDPNSIEYQLSSGTLENEFVDDLKGYDKCNDLLYTANTKNSQLAPSLKIVLPAIEYCNTLNSPIKGYTGYLPAAGQLSFLLKYLNLINYILKHFHFRTLNINIDRWWSSSEYDSGVAWSLLNGYYYRSVKGANISVFPLFHKDTNFD